MNIRPIDLQVMLPRTTDVSKLQTATDQHQALNNVLLSEQWQQIAREREQNVQHVPKEEGGKVGAEKHTKQQQHQQQNPSNRSHNSNDQADPVDPLRGHLIDIIT